MKIPIEDFTDATLMTIMTMMTMMTMMITFSENVYINEGAMFSVTRRSSSDESHSLTELLSY